MYVKDICAIKIIMYMYKIRHYLRHHLHYHFINTHKFLPFISSGFNCSKSV